MSPLLIGYVSLAGIGSAAFIMLGTLHQRRKEEAEDAWARVQKWKDHGEAVENLAKSIAEPVVSVPHVARRFTPVTDYTPPIVLPVRTTMMPQDADDSTSDLLTPIVVGPWFAEPDTEGRASAAA